MTSSLFAASGRLESVRWGFTRADAPSGVSLEPYGRLNLGGHVGDDPSSVETNRDALADDLEVARERLLFLDQVHGADVVRAVGPWPQGRVPSADAMVTSEPDLALAVLVADCVPVLLADPVNGVLGVAHAGRPGFFAGVIREVVAAMRDLGAQTGAGRLRAMVGPSICGRCYEVPASMRDQARAISPVASAITWQGTPAVDIASGVVDQLTAARVAVTWVPGCTRESGDLYSYRRSGVTGRFAGVLVRASGRVAE